MSKIRRLYSVCVALAIVAATVALGTAHPTPVMAANSCTNLSPKTGSHDIAQDLEPSGGDEIVNAALYEYAYTSGGNCYRWYKLVMTGTDWFGDDGTCVNQGYTGSEIVDSGAKIYIRVWVGGIYQGTWGSGGFNSFLCPQAVTTPSFNYGSATNPYGAQADNYGSQLTLDYTSGNVYVSY